MKISEHSSHTGRFFFRWRGYLFLPLLPIFLLSFIQYNPISSPMDDLLWEVGCFLVALLGLSVRVLTVGTVPRGTSGRGTKKPGANVLNTTGMYSIVRHPLYLGNYFIALGISLFLRTWFLPIIASLALIVHYKIVISSEEEYLEGKFGDEFRAWAAKVSVIIPRLNNYQAPKLSFSWKAALRREFYGLFGIITAFFALDFIGDFIAYKRITFDPFWTPLFMIGLVFFSVIRILKKKTHLLEVDGR
jgi:protein-S-isoprenylcysteine O-methyltransferase Ste14